MAVRQAIGLIGKAHLDGHAASTKVLSPGGNIGDADAARLPAALRWGTYGWAHLNVNQFTVTGSFPRNCIITGGTTGVRARVIESRVADLGFLIIERLSLPVDLTVFPPVTQWFTLGETVTADVGAGSGTVGNPAGIGTPIGETGEVNTSLGQVGGQQFNTEAFNPVLNSLIPSDGVTGASGPTNGIFYYRDAKLANLLPVASTAGVPRFRTIFGAFSGARALVVGTVGSSVAIMQRAGDPGTFNTTEAINVEALVSGVATGGGTTFLDDSGAHWKPNGFVGLNLNTSGAPGGGQSLPILSNTATRITFAAATAVGAGTVYNVGAVAAVTTITGAIAVKTVGEWGPFSMRPNLNGLGQNWELPPFGSDAQTRLGCIGVDPYIVKNAFARWGADTRVIKSMTSIAPTTGNQGGAAYGVIPCTTTSPISGTLTVNAATPTIIAGPGGFTATVVAVNVIASHLQIWVKNITKTLASSTSPLLANGSALSWSGASSGTATASDNVYGSMKGAQDYIQFFVDVAAASTKLGGDTLNWNALFLEPWEGDCTHPIAATGTSLGIDGATVVAGYRKLAADLRADLVAPTLVCVFFAHRQESHKTTLPNNAIVIRLALAGLTGQDPKSRVTTPDEFEIAPAGYGGVAADAEGLYLEGFAYPLIGLKMWQSFATASTPLSIGTLSEALPIVVVFGQSQAVGLGQATFWAFENDPLLGKVSSMTDQLGHQGTSTVDPREIIFNARNGAWESLEAFTNATTFGNGIVGSWSVEMSLMQRLIDRYPRIGVIKVPFGASSMQFLPTGQQQGCWAPAFSTPTASPASVVVSDLGGSVFRFTASVTGAFTAFRPTEWITIANGNALQSQVTRPHPAIAPALIMAVSGSGNYIDIQAGLESAFVVSGTFGSPATETALTFKQGPVDLRTSAQQVVTDALTRCMTVLGRIPEVKLIVAWQGEGDAENVVGSTAYEDAYVSALTWMRGLFPRVYKDGDVPIAVLKISTKSPVGSGDVATHVAKIAALQQAQDNLRTRLTNVVTINTDGLPLTLGSQGYTPTTWTPTAGTIAFGDPDNFSARGIHHTSRGAIGAGFLVDAALDSFGGLFPPHPLGTLGSGEFEISPSDTGTTQATTIVVETGSGSTTSESYIDVAFADAYWANRGDPVAWIGATTLQKEAALRESGLIGIDGQFGRLWKGRRLFLNQSMDWPRAGMTNRDGWAVIPGTIPDRLKAAQAEMALTSLTEQMVVDEGPDDRGVSSVSKEAADTGSKKITWSDSSGRGAQTRRMRAEKLLEPFLDLEMRVSRA